MSNDIICVVTVFIFSVPLVGLGFRLYSYYIQLKILKKTNPSETLLMLCPHCKTQLVVNGQARLETLGEHVCDPNGTVSMKDKYTCPNDKCLLGTFFNGRVNPIFWNEDGEFYYDHDIVGFDMFNNIHRLVTGEKFWGVSKRCNCYKFAPYGSIQRSIMREVYWKSMLTVSLYFLRIDLGIRCADADRDGNILRWKPFFTIWKRTSNLGYCWVAGRIC